MQRQSLVLLKLAEWYEGSAAGRHGGGKVDFQPDVEELLSAAGCAEGEARELAERELRAAEDAEVIVLVPIHRRDPQTIAKVRLAPANEESFFHYIGLCSPSARRAEWQALFTEAATWRVPERFEQSWKAFCTSRAGAALSWRGMKPFDRDDITGGRELLTLLPRILAWEGGHLVRWASSVLCGRSKFLERRQRTIESLLMEATAGSAPNYETLGILPVPSGVTFHGPLRVRLGDKWCDYRNVGGKSYLSEGDVERITACECTARRCLTVENQTPFLDLVQKRSSELLIETSYPNQATIGLLRHLQQLPEPPEFWHFGDTDPSGFHILADLRERSGIDVRSFHMRFRPAVSAIPLTPRERALVEDLIPRMPAERSSLEAMLAAGNKGDFEQESLKPPELPMWPFYKGVGEESGE